MRTTWKCMTTAALLAGLSMPAFGQESATEKPAPEKPATEKPATRITITEKPVTEKSKEQRAAEQSALEAAEKQLQAAREQLKAAEAAAEKARLALRQEHYKVLVSQLELTGKLKERNSESSAGKYMIGVGCSEVPGVLRVQLSLPEDRGLVVDHVGTDSPAAKAGMAPFDVIVQVGDKPVGNLQQLIDAVQAAETKETTFTLIRSGKELTVKVTPVERPKSGAVEQYIQLVQPPEGQNQLFKDGSVQIVQPGVVFSARVHELPKHLIIEINRTEKEKARITVKADDKSYEVGEEELDKLPAGVREHVRALLGQAPHLAMIRSMTGMSPITAVPGHPGVAPMTGGVRARMVVGPEATDKQLKQINDKLDKLQKALDALSGGRARKDGKSKEKEGKDNDDDGAAALNLPEGTVTVEVVGEGDIRFTDVNSFDVNGARPLPQKGQDAEDPKAE